MLKLLDAQKAGLYGLPARDMSESDALKALAHLGDGAQWHLDCAIKAGAFKFQIDKTDLTKSVKEN